MKRLFLTLMAFLALAEPAAGKIGKNRLERSQEAPAAESQAAGEDASEGTTTVGEVIAKVGEGHAKSDEATAEASTPETAPAENSDSNSMAEAIKNNSSRAALFNQYKDSVVQIRTINSATGQKQAIGSGFIIGDGSFLATNYHVIAPAATRNNFKVDYLDQNNGQGNLELYAVDIINDLAILKATKVVGKALDFAPGQNQGEALFSLGNPNDFGFVIVEGSNNGFQKNTATPRILFSGALNSGMSGGPTLNSEGQVVGINVATQGNGLGFIVPVAALEKLLKDNKSKQDINQAIAQQLSADNTKYFEQFFKDKFKKVSMSGFSVPTEIGNDVRCWDSSQEPKPEDLLVQENLVCQNDRNIFLSNDMILGNIVYGYTNVYAQENINPFRFYALYSRFNNINQAPRSSKDYGNFDCRSDFVKISERTFKMTYCTQPTKKYEGISDAYMTASLLGENNKGFVIEAIIFGIQPDLASKVFSKLLKEIN